MNDLKFNVRFCGDLELLKWILHKYKTELPYNGSIYNFVAEINYEKTAVNNWKKFGVNNRVWGIVHKDITMAYLMGKIKDIKSLPELKEEHGDIIKNLDAKIKLNEIELKKIKDKIEELSTKERALIQLIEQDLESRAIHLGVSTSNKKVASLDSKSKLNDKNRKNDSDRKAKVVEFIRLLPEGCVFKDIRDNVDINASTSTLFSLLRSLIVDKQIKKTRKNGLKLYTVCTN